MKVLFQILIALQVTLVSAQTVIYADQSAAGDNNGSSWSNAFINLQEALSTVQTGDELWVASGIYKPDHGPSLDPGDQTIRFELVGGASLYGGFRGDETSVESRNIDLNPTVLSGDLLGNDPEGVIPDPSSDDYQDNSEVVLRVSPGTETQRTKVDGVTVRGGTTLALNAVGPCTLLDVSLIENVGPSNSVSCSMRRMMVARNHVLDPWSGVLQVSASTIVDSSFEDNIAIIGAAIQAVSQDSVIVARSIFYNNRAHDGGAITSTGPHVVVVSSLFLRNTAECAGGAIIMDEGGSLTSVNNVFSYNQSNNQVSLCGFIAEGGAIMIYKSRFADYNSTYVFNSAVSNGDVIALRESEGIVSNSIWYSNTPGNADIDLISSQLTVRYLQHDEQLDPLIATSGPVFLESAQFADVLGTDGVAGTNDDNYQLVSTSIGIDAGSTSLIPTDFADLDEDGIRSEPTPHDALGAPRVQGTGSIPAVDLGAFEFPIPVGVETTPEAGSCFQVYPNPFDDFLNVTALNDGVGSVEVFDMVGRKLKGLDVKSTGETWRISTSSWAKGVYLIRKTKQPGCFTLASHF